MKKKDIEKMFNEYEQKGAEIIVQKGDKTHMIKVNGTTIEVLYLFAELVKALNEKTDTDLLKFAFEIGLEDK